MNDFSFKPLPLYREALLKKGELQRYYIQKRKYKLENGTHLKGKCVRKFLHPILYGLLKFSRKFFERQKIEILYDNRNVINRRLLDRKGQKAVIYAMTHIGYYDIQILFEAAKQHIYPFYGDPETSYRTGSGLFVYLNGVIYCDVDDKGGDTSVGKKTAIDALKQGINLIITPEGVWNISANLLVLPLYNGVIDMALSAECDIIPVGIEQYGKTFVVAFGENINVNPNQRTFATAEERKEYIIAQNKRLRDAMATLKWDVISSQPVAKRSDLGAYYKEFRKFKDTRFNEWIDKKTKKPYYDDFIVAQRTYKSKNIT